MTKRVLTGLVLLATLTSRGHAQNVVTPDYLKLAIDERSSERLLDALNSVVLQINGDALDHQYISPTNAGLTFSVLESLRTVGRAAEGETPPPQSVQLINCYAIGKHSYRLTLAYLAIPEASPPQIRMTLDLVADESDDGVTFAVPLAHLTRHWKTRTVGNINYHYRGTLNQRRAETFDAKNTEIAGRLGLPPDAFEFYLCENYQEVLGLMGIAYDAESNGQTRDGYGVDAGTIFSIMNNEDFSHDTFHHYSAKINKREDRNWITEEGVAYSWGNAYYTDPRGEMIEQERLVAELARHLEKHPDADLLELFERDTKVFDHLAPEVSVRSTISSLICDEVERKKGMVGLLRLINCGGKDLMDNYLRAIDELLGVRRDNFNRRIRALVDGYAAAPE